MRTVVLTTKEGIIADEKTTEVTLVDDDTFTTSETEEKEYSYSALVSERAILVENQTTYQTRIDEIDKLLTAFDSAKTEASAKAAEEAAAAEADEDSSESEEVVE